MFQNNIISIGVSLESQITALINFIQNQIARDRLIKLAQETGEIRKFPTVKRELDACQLEITTDTYKRTSIDVADQISEYH